MTLLKSFLCGCGYASVFVVPLLLEKVIYSHSAKKQSFAAIILPPNRYLTHGHTPGRNLRPHSTSPRKSCSYQWSSVSCKRSCSYHCHVQKANPTDLPGGSNKGHPLFDPPGKSGGWLFAHGSDMTNFGYQRLNSTGMSNILRGEVECGLRLRSGVRP